jgi:alpha-1,3-rhamnosyl/mannosyltransferase
MEVPPLRVLLNLLAASGRKTGIGHYASQLLRCLREQAEGDVIDVYPPAWLRRSWSTCNQLRPLLERVYPRRASRPTSASSEPTSHTALMSRLRGWGQAALAGHFRRFCRRRRLDLYHEPNCIPLAAEVPTVVTVPDLSLLHPEWHPADRVAHFERHFPKVLGQGSHFLAISEYCRQELIRTYDLLPDRVSRTYMGVRPGLSVLSPAEVAAGLRQLGLPEKYLLYLGTLEPRKNLLMLLQTYCSLPDSLRQRWPLLLVGSWGWNTAAIRDFLHQEARHRGVHHLGYVAEEHLALIYNGARALIYPSLYEGFGLPPVEMMACGGAVLASTAGALVETVGSCAHLIDAADQDGWRAALLRVIEDDDWWRLLRRGVVEVARPFTWERCAAKTLEVYREVYGRNGDSGKMGNRAA